MWIYEDQQGRASCTLTWAASVLHRPSNSVSSLALAVKWVLKDILRSVPCFGTRECLRHHWGDASGFHCAAEACGLKVIRSVRQPVRGTIAAPVDHRKPRVKKPLSACSSFQHRANRERLSQDWSAWGGHNMGNDALNRRVCFDRLYLRFTVQTYRIMAICILADCDQCTQLTPPRVQQCRRRLNSLAAHDVNPPRCTFNVMPLYYRHPGMDWRPMLICLISSWENSIDFPLFPHLFTRWKHIFPPRSFDPLCLWMFFRRTRSTSRGCARLCAVYVCRGVCVCV